MLFILDAIVSDGSFEGREQYLDITEADINIINSLSNIDDYSYDPYIVSMIKSYRRNKKEIRINLDGLRHLDDEALLKIFVMDKVEQIWMYVADFGSRVVDMSLKSNLISPKLFEILPYSKTLVISCGDSNQSSCSFNLFSFLDIVSAAKTWNKITIKHRVTGRFNTNRSWLYYYCNGDWVHSETSSSLETKCN